MLDKLDQEFDGHISGVTEWGIYIELDDTKIEGMVSLRDLTDDYYTFDEENYCLRGERTGRIFTLGDGVRIRVMRAAPGTQTARFRADRHIRLRYEKGHAGSRDAVNRPLITLCRNCIVTGCCKEQHFVIVDKLLGIYPLAKFLSQKNFLIQKIDCTFEADFALLQTFSAGGRG